MIFQNTLNNLHDFRKLIQNCSRTEIYQWPWYLLSFFHEIYTILRGVWLKSKQNFNYFCLRNFPSFRATTCICWLSCQSSMQCKIQNKFVKLRKFLNAENFSATAIAQAPVQKIWSNRILAFFDFSRKNIVDDCFFGTTFLRKMTKGADQLVDVWDEKNFT